MKKPCGQPWNLSSRMSTSWADHSIGLKQCGGKLVILISQDPTKRKQHVLLSVMLNAMLLHANNILRTSARANMVLNTRKLLNSYIFKPPCNFCIIVVGSRAWAYSSLCRRRWNIALHKKIDGTSLLTSFRDTLSIHKTAVASYYKSADGVGKLHRLHVDFQHHLPAQRLECVRWSHSNEQWHRRVAQRPYPSRWRKSPHSILPPSPTASQGSQTLRCPAQTGLWW